MQGPDVLVVSSPSYDVRQNIAKTFRWLTVHLCCVRLGSNAPLWSFPQQHSSFSWDIDLRKLLIIVLDTLLLFLFSELLVFVVFVVGSIMVWLLLVLVILLTDRISTSLWYYDLWYIMYSKKIFYNGTYLIFVILFYS